MSQKGPGCAFCGIVAGRGPAHIIEEDDSSLCLVDISPLSEGHCLVVSKRHVPWWHDLDDDETVSLFRMARRIANRLGGAFAPDFVRLYARGRRIAHTHLFLVPRRKVGLLDGVVHVMALFREAALELAP